MGEMTVAQLRKSRARAVLENHQVHMEWLLEATKGRDPRSAVAICTSNGAPLIGFVPSEFNGVSVVVSLEAP